MDEDFRDDESPGSSMVFNESNESIKPRREESKHYEKTKKRSTELWAVVGVLVIALALSVFTAGFRDWSFGSTDVDVTGAATKVVATDGMNFIVLNDATCEECDSSRIVDVTRQLFPEVTVVEVDFASDEGQELYEKYAIQFLPAYLFSADVADHPSYAQVSAALVKIEDMYLINPQSSGSTYDPFGEKCENGVDDNNDGMVDCEDADCKGELACMEKKAKPVVDLFVMSHCPFGTQIEKGIIPVIEELGDDVDFNLRFVHYAMHADKEVYEQLNQYCIREEQESKLLSYLKCFLKAGDGEACLKEANIDTDKLDSCVEKADEGFSITANFEDKSTWLGNYPPFNIDKVLTDKYGVGGSPTLVVNGVQVETARDPASLLKTICYGFDEKPEACDAKLDSANPSAGFGFDTVAASATDATCG